MKFLKPWRGGYMIVQGDGKVTTFNEEELKVMSMAYDELRFVKEDCRRSFSFTTQPIDKLMEGIKTRRKCAEDYEQ